MQQSNANTSLSQEVQKTSRKCSINAPHPADKTLYLTFADALSIGLSLARQGACEIRNKTDQKPEGDITPPESWEALVAPMGDTKDADMELPISPGMPLVLNETFRPSNFTRSYFIHNSFGS